MSEEGSSAKEPGASAVNDMEGDNAGEGAGRAGGNGTDARHDENRSRFVVPIVMSIPLLVVYYLGQQTYIKLGPLELVLSPVFDVFISFLFGFFVFGLFGVLTTRLFLFFHSLFKRGKRLGEKYVMIETGYTVTAWVMIKRAFLLYAISIGLSLTTFQFLSFFNLFPDSPDAFLDLFQDQPPAIAARLAEQEYLLLFVQQYTNLVLFYSALLSFVLPPIWYLDDLNLMYYSTEEGVRLLNPFGRSVLPSLKGFGGPTIIISYLIFTLGRKFLYFTLLLDPLVTFYVPMLYLVGFEFISFFGKRNLKKWLEKKGVTTYRSFTIVLQD